MILIIDISGGMYNQIVTKHVTVLFLWLSIYPQFNVRLLKTVLRNSLQDESNCRVTWDQMSALL